MLDYKKIFSNQEIRIKILQMLEFLPDSWMLKLQYKIKMGRKLNLKNPIRFTEKLQWYKLNYRNPVMTKCTDKYTVRQYIESKGLKDILNELYGVYERETEINFDILPEKFVLKTTNGGGGNNVIICQDKNELNKKESRELLKKWMEKNKKSPGREWSYYDIKPRIISEKYLERDRNNDLVDYKFFCFNGEPYCVLICKDRFSSTGLKKGFFDTQLSFLDIGLEEYYFLNANKKQINLEQPENYKQMLSIARILSEDFPHVRVDLYNINGKIVFGELTFYDASGYIDYGMLDFELGNQFKLTSYNC